MSEYESTIVGAFNQESDFVGAFFVIVTTDGMFAALIPTLGIHITQVGQLCHHNIIFSIASVSAQEGLDGTSSEFGSEKIIGFQIGPKYRIM